MNVAVVRGRLTHDAKARKLVEGGRLVALELTVPRPGQRADVVPVVFLDPPPAVELLQQGEEVLVVGRVRRRYFRSAGATASRTELAADEIVPTRLHRRAAMAVAVVIAVIEAEAGGQP